MTKHENTFTTMFLYRNTLQQTLNKPQLSIETVYAWGWGFIIACVQAAINAYQLISHVQNIDYLLNMNNIHLNEKRSNGVGSNSKHRHDSWWVVLKIRVISLPSYVNPGV